MNPPEQHSFNFSTSNVRSLSKYGKCGQCHFARGDRGHGGARTAAEFLYCANVWTVHPELHLATNPRIYRFTAPAAIPNFEPRFNVCPTDPVDTVVAQDGKRELVTMRCGLVPYWWNKPLKELRLATFNARVETVTTKPFFREPFKRKRCLMPVSGYYEWEDTPGGKQPHYFTARAGSSPLLTIAGLWDEWKNKETGERLKSCTMIVTEPNEFIAEVHDRMPVLLKPEQFDHWLSGNMGVKELKPAPNDYLQRWAVSKRVNSSKADANDATLIECSSRQYERVVDQWQPNASMQEILWVLHLSRRIRQ